MAKIAMDEANPPELRAGCLPSGRYVAPKRKAVEHSSEDGSASITVSWMTKEDVRSLPASELVDQVLQRIADGDVPAADVPKLMDVMRDQIGARVS